MEFHYTKAFQGTRLTKAGHQKITVQIIGKLKISKLDDHQPSSHFKKAHHNARPIRHTISVTPTQASFQQLAYSEFGTSMLE